MTNKQTILSLYRGIARFFFTWLLFIASSYAFGQTAISGKVTDISGLPIANANVFLSNAQVGCHTAKDGLFTLQAVKPGHYDLVVSFIGYQTHHQTVAAGADPINLPPIMLKVKNNELNAVNIGLPDPNRAKYLQLFIREFVGKSENAGNCKILNPEILELRYNKADRTLVANSDDFLEVENKALGYKIHYQLTNFKIQWSESALGIYTTYYDGNVLFEEMTGSASQLKKWEKKRLETYLGSEMHFLRDIIANKIDSDGFKVLRLISPFLPADSLLKANSKKYIVYPNKDGSGSYEFLDTKNPLHQKDYVKRIDAKNIYALTFPDYLYIAYPKKKSMLPADLTPYTGSFPSYYVSIVKVKSKFSIFDNNGIFLDPSNTLVQGQWAISGTADLLPIDYQPLKDIN